MKAFLIILAYMIEIMSDIPVAKNNPVPAQYIGITHLNSVDTAFTSYFRIRPFHLEIVPPSSGIQFYRDGIIFLAQSKVQEKIPERHLSFGSIRIYTALIADTMPVNYLPFNLAGSALFPTEAITFTSDYNTMYLSLIPEKVNSEKIFSAKWSPSGWKIDDTPLEICTGNYIYSHPCLAPNESFMIFSSDMPGTKGGLDLFITKREGNRWSNPENIGKDINSSGNDLFASLDSRNNLYFSSDGHPGKGGYDIYICRYNGSGWEKPQNLSEPINTIDDELAFTINNPDGKVAFFVSRQRSGKKRTQIFILDRKPDISLKPELSLSECFMAMVGRSEVFPYTGKPKEDPKINVSASIQEIIGKKPGEKSDGVQHTPTTDITETKKDPVTSIKSSQSPSNTGSTKELTSEITKSQTAAETNKDAIIYRVQILANTKPAGIQNIFVAGNNYKSFEYFYKGGYRTTIGEFNTLAEAVRLQNTCRQNGYKEAFVVAFKNNVRSTDPALFK